MDNYKYGIETTTEAGSIIRIFKSLSDKGGWQIILDRNDGSDDAILVLNFSDEVIDNIYLMRNFLQAGEEAS